MNAVWRMGLIEIVRCTRVQSMLAIRVRDCVAGRLRRSPSLWIAASFILMAGCDGRLAQCETDIVGMRARYLSPAASLPRQNPIPATIKETNDVQPDTIRVDAN